MNTAISSNPVRPLDMPAARAHADAMGVSAGNVRTAWMVLKATFTLVPILAGLDKFTDLLAHWEDYLNPALAHLLPMNPHTFMEVAGVIEIVAGITVFLRPRIGALVVTAWLACIALSLIASGHYLDVAVRDLVMAAGAFALARLTPGSPFGGKNLLTFSRTLLH